MSLLLRRGTDAERLTITPAEGEPIWTTDTDKLFVGDGITAGGREISGTATSATTSTLRSPNGLANVTLTDVGALLWNDNRAFITTGTVTGTNLTYLVTRNNWNGITDGNNFSQVSLQSNGVRFRHSTTASGILVNQLWTLNEVGFTFPNSTVQTTAFTGTGDIAFDGTWIRNTGTGDIYISPQDGNTGIYFPSDSGAGNGGAVSLFNYDSSGTVRISVADKSWNFNSDGTFSTPNGNGLIYANTLTSLTNAPISLATQGGAVNIDNWGYPTNAMRITNATDNESIIIQGNGDGAQAKLRWHETPGESYRSIYSEVRVESDGVQIINSDWSDSPGYDWHWKFNLDGSQEFPTLTTPHAGTGQTLRFGDSSKQVIITNSTATSTYPNSQRMIIQGSEGYVDGGEGGDIYLWAGNSGAGGGSGGDIKIDAGQGYSDSEGGTIKIRAGGSDGGIGGFVEIHGGQGVDAAGPIRMYSGSGSQQLQIDNDGITVKGPLTMDPDRVIYAHQGAYGVPDNSFTNARIGLYGSNTDYAIGVESDHVWIKGTAGVKLYSGDNVARLNVESTGITVNGSITNTGSVQQDFTYTDITTADPIDMAAMDMTLVGTVKYIVQVRELDGNAFHSQECFMMGDGTNTYLSQTNVLTTSGELGTFTMNSDGTTAYLRFTPNYTPASMTIRVSTTAILL
jgi:hypothetical protein